MWYISSQLHEIWYNVCMQSKTQSAQYLKNGSTILRLIEQKYSISLHLLLNGRAEPMRGIRLSAWLIESRLCGVFSMGLRCLPRGFSMEQDSYLCFRMLLDEKTDINKWLWYTLLGHILFSMFFATKDIIYWTY